MPKPYKRIEVGTTPQFTWIGSANPISVGLAIIKSDGTLVNSGPAVNSGSGNYYRFVTIPDSFPSYPVTLKAQWTSVASTHVSGQTPFIHVMLFDVVKTRAWGT